MKKTPSPDEVRNRILSISFPQSTRAIRHIVSRELESKLETITIRKILREFEKYGYVKRIDFRSNNIIWDKGEHYEHGVEIYERLLLESQPDCVYFLPNWRQMEIRYKGKCCRDNMFIYDVGFCKEQCKMRVPQC